MSFDRNHRSVTSPSDAIIPVVPAHIVSPIAPLAIGEHPRDKRDTPKPKTRKTPLIAGAIVLALLAVVGGYYLCRDTTFTFTGHVILDSEWTSGEGDTCIGKMDHEDIHQGTKVVLFGALDQVIGHTPLAPGYITDRQCHFDFTATVETGEQAYGAAVEGRLDNIAKYGEKLLRSGKEPTLTYAPKPY